MVRNSPLTAVIPARAGSKGIPGKNLYVFCGQTLLERAIGFSKASDRIDDVYVTTDDPEMQKIALSAGAKAPFLRPVQLAKDDTPTIYALQHLLSGVAIDKGYVVLLQVTSPLRVCSDLDEICEKLEANPEADGVVSVVRHIEPHPEKLVQVRDGYLNSYLGGNPSVPRQTLSEVYALNGAFYVTSVKIIMKEGTLWGSKTIPHIMPRNRSVNIDCDIDLVLLEALTANDHVVPETYT